MAPWWALVVGLISGVVFLSLSVLFIALCCSCIRRKPRTTESKERLDVETASNNNEKAYINHAMAEDEYSVPLKRKSKTDKSKTGDDQKKKKESHQKNEEDGEVESPNVPPKLDDHETLENDVKHEKKQNGVTWNDAPEIINDQNDSNIEDENKRNTEIESDAQEVEDTVQTADDNENSNEENRNSSQMYKKSNEDNEDSFEDNNKSNEDNVNSNENHKKSNEASKYSNEDDKTSYEDENSYEDNENSTEDKYSNENSKKSNEDNENLNEDNENLKEDNENLNEDNENLNEDNKYLNENHEDLNENHEDSNEGNKYSNENDENSYEDNENSYEDNKYSNEDNENSYEDKNSNEDSENSTEDKYSNGKSKKSNEDNENLNEDNQYSNEDENSYEEHENSNENNKKSNEDHENSSEDIENLHEDNGVGQNQEGMTYHNEDNNRDDDSEQETEVLEEEEESHQNGEGSHDEGINGSLTPVRSVPASLLAAKNLEPSKVSLIRLVREGVYGAIYKGEIERDGKDVPALIKTFPENAPYTEAQLNEFLRQGTKLQSLEHKYLLAPYGVTEKRDMPIVVYPEAYNLDLKSYIVDPHHVLSHRHMLDFSLSISEAMAYLHEHDIVHEDLAARNCWLTEKRDIKVCDGALSHDIFPEDYEKTQEIKEPMPIRWMAPECLMAGGNFTQYSDVWAYGILVWELFKRGQEKPYWELPAQKVYNNVIDGDILVKPFFAPDAVYELIKKCWTKNPEERPSFTEIVVKFQNEIYKRTSQKRQTYNALSPK